MIGTLNQSLTDLFAWSTFSSTGNSIEGNGNLYIDFNVAKDGYTALGAIHSGVTQTSRVAIRSTAFVADTDNKTIRLLVENISSSTVNYASFNLCVLYVKDSVKVATI